MKIFERCTSTVWDTSCQVSPSVCLFSPQTSWIKSNWINLLHLAPYHNSPLWTITGWQSDRIRCHVEHVRSTAANWGHSLHFTDSCEVLSVPRNFASWSLIYVSFSYLGQCNCNFTLWNFRLDPALHWSYWFYFERFQFLWPTVLAPSMRKYIVCRALNTKRIICKWKLFSFTLSFISDKLC